jgi:hypothetical protein
MAGSPFARRKPTAYDRACLSRRKILIKDDETGRIYCRKPTHYSRKLQKKALNLLQENTVQRLKSYLELKGFRGYSKLRKKELIDMILNHTDWLTGEIVYRRKILEDDEMKFASRGSHRSKNARRSKSKRR